MTKIVDEKELLRHLATLPREIAPAGDIWPLISARISTADTVPAARRPRFWPAALAASLFVIVSTGLLLERLWTGAAALSSGNNSASGLTRQGGRQDVPASGAVGELEYQAALREFMALDAATGVDDGLQPEWIEQGWGTLREVELQLSEALKAEPNNEFLKSRLAALRARQIELLRQIVAVDQAMRRNNI